MKKLGMIGGTSWHSTVVYYKEINNKVTDKLGTHLNPELILYSLNVEIMREGDFDKIKSKYLDISNKLINSGAEAIIICANTPHLVYEHVSPKIDIPIIHIGDATAKSAKDNNIGKLGLLGTMPTMKEDFLKGRISEKHGIEVIIPEEDTVDEVHRYIADELTQGKFTDTAKEFYTTEIEKLRSRGAEGIILGCTELPILLNQKDFEIPLMDTTDLHCNMAVDFILS